MGGGIGVAPLLCLEEELPEAPTVAARLPHRRLRRGRRALRGEPQVATDDGSGRAARALVTELLAAETRRGPARDVYACGPPPMLEAVRAICAERGVPAQLALESGMACGFGACFGCVVPHADGYLRLCVDGPVVDAAASRRR